ncbi:LAFE_0C07228g1_1 [Lachancea fermentati]|uniref:LAFE_0C07228g1_1 n=1 Tax=Lachancea fermentati TaxID=4955 RepID=A0A1G4MA32_LACFM|nr:LAFE_0C07228g1_1 [Lachancea fermentati]
MTEDEKQMSLEPVSDSTESGSIEPSLTEDSAKRKSEELESTVKARPRKVIKTEEKRIPNIALELAKNRTTVKSHSPSPLNSSSIPLASLLSNEPQSAPAEGSSRLPAINPEVQRTTLYNNSRLKVASLLSDNNDVPQNKTATKVILPTQNSDLSTAESDTPGILVARINSPVAALPKPNILGLNRSQSTLNPMNGPDTADVAKKTLSASSVTSKPTVKKQNARKANDSKNSKKEVNSTEVKKETKKVGKSTETKKATKGKDTTKKEVKSSEQKPEAKHEAKSTIQDAKDSKSGEVKKDPKDSEVKKDGKVNESKKETKSNESKPKAAKRGNSASKKKDPTPQPPKKPSENKSPHLTPRKLIPAPLLKSPSILDVLEKPKGTDISEDPIIIMDVPLFPTESSEYLDENGQVVINFYKMVQDKFGNSNKTKRQLISGLNAQEEDEDDAAEVEDDDGEDDDEADDDEDDEKQGASAASTASPKKKSHPMKGKSLIGKYDTEDPFIDDSELLWEEQRVATKDGFFVYYGPLIEKGQYASFERVNGTMKRGGIKYSR